MSAGGTEEQDSEQSTASAKGPARERPIFSSSEQEEILETARRLASDLEYLHDFAQQELLVNAVILSKIKWKVKGRQAAQQIVATIKQGEDLLMELVKNREALRGEKAVDIGDEILSGDGEDEEDGPRSEGGQEEDGGSDEAVLDEATELLAGL